MIVTALLCGLASANPYAKPAPATVAEAPPFRWVTGPATVKAEGRLEVKLVVPPGTEVYQDQLEIRVKEAGALKVGAPDLPPARAHADPVTGRENRHFYDRDVIVWLPVEVPEGVSGTHVVTLGLRYQGCQGRRCWPPAEEDRTLAVTVAP